MTEVKSIFAEYSFFHLGLLNNFGKEKLIFFFLTDTGNNYSGNNNVMEILK